MKLKVFVTQSILLMGLFWIEETYARTIIEPVDTLPNDSYDNFKVNTTYSASYVVIKSRYGDKVLFQHNLEHGSCGSCYDTIAAIADSCFKKENYTDATTLYTVAFRLNGDKGRVRHRLNAACCFAMLNDTASALDNLERVVFVAKFTNYYVISSASCYRSLHNDPRWKLLLDGIKKNMEAIGRY